MTGIRRYLVFGLLGIAGLFAVMTHYGATSEGQEAAPKLVVGRYQIAAFGNISADARGVTGLHGYYVLDTATGKVVAQKVTSMEYEELPPALQRIR